MGSQLKGAWSVRRSDSETAFSTLLSCSQFRVEHRTVSAHIRTRAKILLYVGSYDNYAYI